MLLQKQFKPNGEKKSVAFLTKFPWFWTIQKKIFQQPMKIPNRSFEKKRWKWENQAFYMNHKNIDWIVKFKFEMTKSKANSRNKRQTLWKRPHSDDHIMLTNCAQQMNSTYNHQLGPLWIRFRIRALYMFRILFQAPYEH